MSHHVRFKKIIENKNKMELIIWDTKLVAKAQDFADQLSPVFG